MDVQRRWKGSKESIQRENRLFYGILAAWGWGNTFAKTFVCNLGSSVIAIGRHIQTYTGPRTKKEMTSRPTSVVEIITKIIFPWYVEYLEKLKNNKNIETFNSILFDLFGKLLAGNTCIGPFSCRAILKQWSCFYQISFLQGEWILLFHCA